MFPVLFQIPAFPAWLAAVLLALVGGLFVWFALRDREDRSSWWLALVFGAAAVAVLAKFGAAKPIGPLPIRLFGILVVLGFLAATKVAAIRNRRLALLQPDETFDLAFYVLLVGLLGARALHVLQHTDDFAGKPGKMIAIWDGGLVWYGGAVAATLYAWWWLAKRRKPIWEVSDSLALGVVLGQAIGRLGCFAAGCDYGRRIPGGPESIPWAIHFPEDPEGLSLVPFSFREDPATGDPVYLHPVQIYLVLMNLAIFGILWLVDRRATKGAFPGRLAALYLMLYAVGRGVVEHWRGDVDRGEYDLGIVEASFSQIVSVFVLFGGWMLYRALRKRAHHRPAAA